MRLAFADYDLPTVSRVFLYLYTGDYDDETYPNLGHNAKPIASSPGEEITNLQQRDDKTSDNKDPADDTQPVFARNVTALVKRNLKVYLCAKALQIESLEALALVKLESNCCNDLESADVASIISYVYEHSTHEDLKLRTMVMRSCTKNMPLATGDAEIVSLLKKHEPLAWTLIEETWRNAVDLTTVGKAPNDERQAEFHKMQVECEQLRTELKSVATALVKFGRPQPDQQSQTARLKAEITVLRAQNNHLETEASRLTKANTDLWNEREALQKKLSQEYQKKDNKHQALMKKNFVLENKFEETQVDLRKAESRRFAWGALNREKKELKEEVDWLKNTLTNAQRLVQNTRECRQCHYAFWALLKVNLHKNDVWVKCARCGVNHR